MGRTWVPAGIRYITQLLIAVAESAQGVCAFLASLLLAYNHRNPDSNITTTRSMVAPAEKPTWYRGVHTLAPAVRELHRALPAEAFPPISTCLVRCRAVACCVKGASVPAGAVQTRGQLWVATMQHCAAAQLLEAAPPAGFLPLTPLFGRVAPVQPSL